MKTLFFIVFLLMLAAAPLTYWGVVFLQKYQITQALIGETTCYTQLSNNYSKTLLVLGDSTGVGVGATRPEDSVAGRVAVSMGASYVENRAVSGAVAADIEKQFENAKLANYDVILIQVGGNDIVRFHDPNKTADVLSESVRTAVEHSSKTILMSAGDVGATTIFPEPIRPSYTKLTLRFHEAFGTMAAKEGATYINLYEPPAIDPFRADPEKYLAIDGFHPSSDGYELWFEKLESVISI
ncbi:SGNH/GDSL hydrolase family protein [Patescibacteria group bacterium]|nr:SGNH/GDSL hydrolase family protein [Patescibacteria group bacterium]